MILPSCKKDEKPQSPFTITEMVPAAAFPGETMEIKGKGFVAAADQNHVYFNNIEALVNSASATSLVVVVPQGTSTGKVKVEVNGVFAESTNDFTVKQAAGEAPVISGFSPVSAPPGAELTISGHHFSSTAAENNVLINETVATVTEADSNSLKIRVPTGASTGRITVTVQGRAASSADVFAVEDTTAAAPVISGFSPMEGIAGDPVTIQGSNFSLTREENLVYVNGVRASVTIASTNMLRIVVPQEAASGKISIRVNGKEVTSAQDFTVPEAPVISSFSPAEGPEGTELTILGTHFGATPAANMVYLNNTAIPATFASEHMLKISIPVGASTGRISVTANGMTARTSSTFKVGCFVPREVSGMYGDASGRRGQPLLLWVLCTSPNAADNVLTFGGGVTAVAESVTDISWMIGEPNWYQLSVTVPLTAQSGQITLTVNGHSFSSYDAFNIID